MYSLIQRPALRAVIVPILSLASLVHGTTIAAARTNDSNDEVLVEVAPSTIYPNQQVNLIVRVPGQATSEPSFPDFRGATVRAGRSGESTYKGRRYATFLYNMVASAPGDLVIPPISVETRSGVLKSKPTTVHVADNAALMEKARSGSKAFTVAAPISGKIYQRQSFPLTLTIFYDPRVQPSGAPEFTSKGYGTTPFDRQQFNGEILIDDKRFGYLAFTTMVTPVESGTLRVADLTAPMIAYETDRIDSIFSTRRGIAFAADGEDLEFEITPLPPHDANFSGAVGEYSMEVAIPKVPTATGDPVEVEIRIKGRGEEQFVSAPLLDDPDENWRIYDMGQSRVVEDDGTIIFRKVLRPENPTATIPAFNFTFFSPEREKYVTLSSEPTELPWDLSKFPKPKPLDAPGKPSGELAPAASANLATIAFPSLENPRWNFQAPTLGSMKLVNITGAGAAFLTLLAVGLTRSTKRQANPPGDLKSLLKVAKTSRAPLATRLHALIRARESIGMDNSNGSVDWQLIEQTHHTLTYSPEHSDIQGERVPAETQQQVAGQIPAAILAIRKHASLPEAARRLTPTTAIVLTLMICLPSFARADSRNDSLEKAKAAIAEENWGAAIEAFTRLKESGQCSPETLLAEGATYARAENPARAKASFAQALAMDFGTFTSVRRNYKLLGGDANEAAFRQLALITFPRPSLWIACAAAFWLTLIAWIARARLRPRWTATAAASLAGVIFLLTLGTALYLASFPPVEKISVITTAETLRSMPVAATSSGSPIGGGELAIVKEHSGGFVLVEQIAEPGNSGWVAKDALEKLTLAPSN